MPSALQFILGSTEAKAHIEAIRRNGWGRMWLPGRTPRPFEGECYGLDNGAFGCWRRCEPWDADGYLRWVEKCSRLPRPYIAVLPDVVCGGVASLEFSAGWLDRLPVEWPWYLAVQNGMTPADVSPMLPRIAGLFLGGDDAFKATAWEWSALAHDAGKKFHYARAATRHKLHLARMSNADSADGVFPIWKRERLEQFERWWREGESQLLIRWQ